MLALCIVWACPRPAAYPSGLCLPHAPETCAHGEYAADCAACDDEYESMDDAYHAESGYALGYLLAEGMTLSEVAALT